MVINSGTGSEVLEIRDAGTVVLSLTYPSGMDVGNALELQVSTNPSIGPATTIAASIASLNANGISGALSQTGTGTQSAQALYYYFPPMAQGFTAEGTVSLTYPASLPSGSRVQFTVRAGTIPCTSTNTPPTVSITAPVANTVFNTPATITVTANAQDSDGTVTQVVFYANGIPIGTATASPFTIQWANVPAGAYSLTAVATDNGGLTTTSAAVPIAVNAIKAIYFIHVDHLNTPRLIADSTGTTVWRYDNTEPFADSVPDENPSGLGAFEFPLGFAGQYRDKETGTAQNWFRDYSPSIGRYNQSDPIGLRGGVNTFAYVDSDPLSYVDPNGLQIGGAVGGSSGLGVGGLLGGRGLNPGKQRPNDPADALGEYMQPGATPTGPMLATPVDPDEVIAGTPVPPFPGIKNLSADCKPGRRVVLVITRGTHKGRTNIEQEYQCTCGLVTWHLIVTPNGKVVHNHFRSGGAKGTADD